jgi:hypothetical protein
LANRTCLTEPAGEPGATDAGAGGAGTANQLRPPSVVLRIRSVVQPVAAQGGTASIQPVEADTKLTDSGLSAGPGLVELTDSGLSGGPGLVELTDSGLSAGPGLVELTDSGLSGSPELAERALSAGPGLAELAG